MSIGAIILIAYGIVAIWQTASFGRVYATYGAIFILIAIFWGWKVEGIKPDKFDIIVDAIAFAGA